MMRDARYWLGLALALCIGLSSQCRAAEAVKIGVVKTVGAGPLYIAEDRGYFAAEGLDLTIVEFDAAQIVTQATFAGDVDIGVTGFSAAFYNLAAKGGLKIIGGTAREAPGFHNTAYVAPNRAWDAGLRSLKDLGHSSIAVPQAGGPLQYEVALLADKYGLDFKNMRFLTLQTVPNVATAVIGGQPDVGLLPSNLALQIADRRQGHILGWVGDETPWQFGALFVATKTADRRGPMIEAALRAYRKGVHDYADAFTGPNGQRVDGPTAPVVLAILAKHLDQPASQLDQAIGYNDPDARLDIADVHRQVEWFKAQHMIPANADSAAMIDMRYVKPLPGG
jgi:NitT/TauT family transport system substrate-binding protein